MSNYIIADIHGCLFTLRKLIEEEICISKSDNIYFLGDYIDRGPRSAQVIEYLIDLKKNGYSLFPIRGNHEQMILDAMYSSSGYNMWMLNSGKTTLQSYKEMLGSFFEFPEDIPDKHILFFTRLPFYYEIESKYILIHGSLNFGIPNPFTDTDAMLWNRPANMPSNFLPGKVLIYGHTPTPLESIKTVVKNYQSRQIPLDAGCVYSKSLNGCGYLAALRLDDFQLFHVKNIDID